MFPFTCQVVNQSDVALVVLCTYDSELGSNTSWSSGHLFLHKWQEQTRLLVHPRTVYVCELYHATSSYLVSNVTSMLPLPSAGASSSG